MTPQEQEGYVPELEARFEPTECIRCGVGGGPPARVDAEHPGWMCADCYTRLSFGENDSFGGYWLCAGKCGQWRKGDPASHNGSGPVCDNCEYDVRVERDYQRDHEDNWRGD